MHIELFTMSKIPLKELQELVTAGIIPQERAERINSYYQEKKQTAPNWKTQIEVRESIEEKLQK